MLPLLIKHAKLSPKREYELLIRAVYFANVQSVELLLAKGVDVNPKGVTVTPLMRAVESRAVPATIVKKLLDAGADIHAKDPKGRTAMDYLQGAMVEEFEDGTHNLLGPGDKDFEEKMKLLFETRVKFHRLRLEMTEAKDI